LHPDVCCDFLQIYYGFHCRVENGYDQVDLCGPWNESQGQYYRDGLLSQQMLPAIKHAIGDTFDFQQDLHLTVPMTPINCYSKKRRTTLVLISGHQTAQTWIQLTIRSGVMCSRKRMNVVWTVSMSWSSASLKSGTVCIRTLLTRPSMNG